MSLRTRLGSAREALGTRLAGVRGRDEVDAATWDKLEEALILADVGVATSTALLARVRERAGADGVSDGADVVDLLKAEIIGRLDGGARSLSERASPSVWLFVGVNGVGKTTTIGRLGHLRVSAGRSVVFAAGDTYRAAAVDQLVLWAGRAGATVVRGAEGADPSSVVFDAIEHAAAQGADLVLADTAGRVHTRRNLMDVLAKVRRVAEKGAGSVTE
ncbi:MAG: signal recognition particle-docking protein FtsY, partial [Phycisphaeraceae bacterium]|nr:signal recognition particle-docking protein FtsY [Phycisphaeraceae bacterium]